MSAQIIPLNSVKKVENIAPMRAPSGPSFRASLTGVAQCWWQGARLTVEAIGWIVVVTSVAAALWL